MYKAPTAPRIELPQTSGAWRTQSQAVAPRDQVGNVNGTIDKLMNVNANVTSQQKNSLLNSMMSPEALAALGMGGLGIGSAYMTNKANAAEGAKNRQAQLNALLSGITGDELDDTRQRQIAYLNSTQMDPISQSRDLFSGAMLGELAKNGPMTADSSGLHNTFSPSSAAMNFMSPEALAENAARFHAAAGQVNPGAPHADLSAMGFGAAGASRQGQVDTSINDAAARYQQLQGQRRQELMGTIGAGRPGGPEALADGTVPIRKGDGTPIPNPDPAHYVLDQNRSLWVPKQEGGGHASLLKHILGGAALVGSSFIPGMPAVVAPYLMSAGVGMGVGGVKGAINGAVGQGINQGMGAATDYFNRPSVTRGGGNF